MDAPRTLLHRETVVVRWGDMDSVGHVNNASYFVYMECARVGWLQQLAISIGVSENPFGPVAANAFCSFLRAVVFPTTLSISVWGGAPGNSSFETYYEMRDADDESVLYCEGSARLVWVDYRSGRPAPLPETIRALLPAAGC